MARSHNVGLAALMLMAAIVAPCVTATDVEGLLETASQLVDSVASGVQGVVHPTLPPVTCPSCPVFPVFPPTDLVPPIAPAPTCLNGTYTLPNPILTYGYDALLPNIDVLTMKLHSNRHWCSFLTALNPVIISYPKLAALSITELNKLVGTASIPTNISTIVRNNAGGHFNHAFFFQTLAPTNSSTTVPPATNSTLGIAITANFGSFANFTAQFSAAAAGRFGSGWAWLIVQAGGKLAVTSTPNQDNPLQTVADLQGIPILGLDVFEHAYYLKYYNVRASYITAFYNVINWTKVASLYADALLGKAFTP